MELRKDSRCVFLAVEGASGAAIGTVVERMIHDGIGLELASAYFAPGILGVPLLYCSDATACEALQTALQKEATEWNPPLASTIRTSEGSVKLEVLDGCLVVPLECPGHAFFAESIIKRSEQKKSSRADPVCAIGAQVADRAVVVLAKYNGDNPAALLAAIASQNFHVPECSFLVHSVRSTEPGIPGAIIQRAHDNYDCGMHLVYWEERSVPVAESTGREPQSLKHGIKTFALYIGGYTAAQSEKGFRSHNITHCVNCAVSDGVTNAMQPLGVIYGQIKSDDTRISRWGPSDVLANDPGVQWPAALDVCHAAYARCEGLLIHCWAGMNRSVTTAAIFLLQLKLAPTVDEAVSFIKARRVIAGPHPVYLRYADKFIAGAVPADPRLETATLVRDYCTGACSIITHDYVRDDTAIDLTVFLVRDHTSNFTAPFESRDRDRRGWERRTRCGWRALEEELHVTEFSQDDVRNPSKFKMITVFTHAASSARAKRDDNAKYYNDAIFISKRPPGELAWFSRTEFAKRRSACKAAGMGECFLETTELVHVPVRNLLAADMSEVCPIVQDIDGRDIILRNIFAAVIRDPAVRDELMYQLRVFRMRHPKPFGGAGAATEGTGASP